MAAAVVRGMVASGVIKVVIKQIGSAIVGKIKLHKNLTKDLEKMKMTSALLWVNRLKAAMYDISDMLDDFESDTQALFGAMRKKINMPDKMKKMQKRLQKITADHQNYSVPPETHTNEQQVPDIWEYAGNLEEAEIIGRTGDKLEILARLLGSATEGTTFVPVWGFGGIGKTTLARSVYNDLEFEKHSRVWVYVSQIFDLKKIGNTIISQLSEQQSQQIPDSHSINIRLQKLLAKKKNTLIILDDLWEKHPSQLEELKSMLRQGDGCKVMVVVTTRDEGIANEIGTVQPYNLPQLSDEICWEIMKQKSKFETRDDKERLEPIGRDIAKKCKGLALAAQSLGHMLKSKSYGQWNSGQDMNKDDLIHQWIALRFVEPSSTFSNLQLGESYIVQLLEMSFLQRPKAVVERYSTDNIVTLFTMHGLVHDLASSNRLVASIGQLKQLRYLSAPYIDGRVDLGCIALPESIGEMEGLMYLNLSGCPNLKELPHSFANLKELVYLNLSKSDNVLGLHEALANLTKLQQLELTACKNLKGHPEVISNLTELRYLRLSGCMHHIFDSSSTDQTESFIDSICRLPNMEHLDLSFNGHPLISIPESASCLPKLVLKGCSQVARLPECVAKMDRQSLFGLLPKFSVTANDSTCCTNLGLLEHVNPDKLDIEKLEKVKFREEARSVKLIEKQRIEELTLKWRPKAKRYVDDMELLRGLVPPTSLQKFEISGYISASFPDWLMSIGNYLPNIVHMSMVNLPSCHILPPLAQLPPHLRVLILGRMESLEEWNTTLSIGEDELIFRELEEVIIHDCPKLRITPHLPRAATWNIKGSDNVLISWAESLSHNGVSSSSSSDLTVESSKVPLH
uniref:Putative NBS-LRR type resistance protein n=1 Tax=Triticum monococcum TaxID=4568 RepID=Q5NKQ5_TRIMO|nr:putative NBS-LRR type resistance protein [Triticum monococcum]